MPCKPGTFLVHQTHGMIRGHMYCWVVVPCMGIMQCCCSLALPIVSTCAVVRDLWSVAWVVCVCDDTCSVCFLVFGCLVLFHTCAAHECSTHMQLHSTWGFNNSHTPSQLLPIQYPHHYHHTTAIITTTNNNHLDHHYHRCHHKGVYATQSRAATGTLPRPPRLVCTAPQCMDIRVLCTPAVAQ